MKTITRRSVLGGLAAASAATAIPRSWGQTKLKGRIKQSVCKWCYRDVSVEDLANAASGMGIVGMDLIGPDDWPMAFKYGVRPVMAYSGSTIPDGLNAKANHLKLEPEFRKNIDLAAKAGVPNLICFSGSRRGMSDEEGLENCRIILDKVKAQAGDKGVMIVMELLNSKVDHKDYQCDHTRWGVELVKRVNSPRFRLLYDIYHMQIMEGDVIRTIRDNIQYIAHFHTGGVPGRNEIDQSQELNYATVTKAIIDTGFSGYMAHEFIPKRQPLASLREAVLLCDV